MEQRGRRPSYAWRRLCLIVGALWSLPSYAQESPRPAGWEGVAASQRVDVTVAWSAERIRVFPGSRTVLDGPGEVGAATVGPDGSVYAVRGDNRFGVAEPDGRETWHPTPVAGRTMDLEILGDWVAWLVWQEDVGPSLALTRTQGKQWVLQTLPPLDEGHFWLGPDGRLSLVARIYDCHGGDYSIYYRGRLGAKTWKRIPWSGEASESSSLGHDGALYAFPTVAGRRWTFARGWDAQPTLYRLSAGRKVVVDRNVPADMQLEAVDFQGRVLGLHDGEVWRWSPQQRWHKLIAPTTQ